MPDALYFTDDEAACKLLATDPFALLMGFAIDQQVPVQKAFAGPLALQQRVGTLDPEKLAGLDLEEAFRAKPAIHRFPGSMANRVRELAAVVAEDYDGDASRIWNDAADAADLKKRLSALPGFGPMKVTALASVLAYRFGLEAAKSLAPGPRLPREGRLAAGARRLPVGKAGAQGRAQGLVGQALTRVSDAAEGAGRGGALPRRLRPPSRRSSRSASRRCPSAPTASLSLARSVRISSRIASTERPSSAGIVLAFQSTAHELRADAGECGDEHEQDARDDQDREPDRHRGRERGGRRCEREQNDQR